MLELDVDAGMAFETATGPDLFAKFTLFPLHGILPGGSCACGRPGCNQAGKHPAIKWGPDDLPAGTKMVRRPDGTGVGLGLATGSRSGGVVVIDVDTKAGGFETLEALEARIGPLPRTLYVESPSGGGHLYFRHPGKFQTQAGKLGPGVDVRGEGGYVVTPGSPHRKGGHYRVAEAAPVADLPGVWADALPRAGVVSTALVEAQTVVDPSTLRQRLSDHVKGRKGDGWESWRRLARGERFIRQPEQEGDAPLCHGVDEYLNKTMIAALLASDEAWHTIPAVDMAEVAAASLGILQLDAASLGRSSKWTREHFAEKWAYWCSRDAAARAESQAFVDRITRAAAEGAEKRAGALPLVVAISGRAYLVLDDRHEDPARHRYVGPMDGATLVPMARHLWGTRRPLEMEAGKGGGLKDMAPADVVRMYGRPVERFAYDITAAVPRVDDVLLVIPSRSLDVPPSVYDQEVEIWLRHLGDDRLLDWIAWSALDKAETTIPALALIGGAHVGKSLLAAGLARAAGLPAPGGLKKALGRFASVIAHSPILFGDEGIPRGDRGEPMTEEFRDLATRKDHAIEIKGVDRHVNVHGNVRIILAANRADRLFSNAGGHLSAEDVDAIVRRLLVVEIFDPARASAAKDAAERLGPGGEGCPIRLSRVAGHLRWLQEFRQCPAPGPRALSLRSDLRRGSDLCRKALERLEDAYAGRVEWAVSDGSSLWVQPGAWAQGVGVESSPLMRALRAYVVKDSAPLRAHPVTRVTLPVRQRWASLDLSKLRADGWDFPETETGPAESS
jgi:hypothetical protein